MTGLVLIVLFYVADISVMHIVPLFVSDERAMMMMTTLHLGYNWIISTIGVTLIVLSIVYFNRVLFPRIMRLEHELKKLASTDSLTNAYNRSKFDEIIIKETERAKRYNHLLSLVIFDVDHFREVNDTYGHLFGDYVLKSIANLTRNNIRRIDYLVRWGGEEFMIILTETELKRAEALAARIKKEVELFNFKENVKVTVSFGVTQFRKDDSAGTFIKRADDGLYKAKVNGRNRVEVGV